MLTLLLYSHMSIIFCDGFHKSKTVYYLFLDTNCSGYSTTFQGVLPSTQQTSSNYWMQVAQSVSLTLSFLFFLPDREREGETDRQTDRVLC